MDGKQHSARSGNFSRSCRKLIARSLHRLEPVCLSQRNPQAGQTAPRWKRYAIVRMWNNRKRTFCRWTSLQFLSQLPRYCRVSGSVLREPFSGGLRYQIPGLCPALVVCRCRCCLREKPADSLPYQCPVRSGGLGFSAGPAECTGAVSLSLIYPTGRPFCFADWLHGYGNIFQPCVRPVSSYYSARLSNIFNNAIEHSHQFAAKRPAARPKSRWGRQAHPSGVFPAGRYRAGFICRQRHGRRKLFSPGLQVYPGRQQPRSPAGYGEALRAAL